MADLNKIKARMKAAAMKTVANGATKEEELASIALVTKWQEQYGLTMEDIEAETYTFAKRSGAANFKKDGTPTFHVLDRKLSVAVAEHFACKVLSTMDITATPRDAGGVTFVGMSEDAECALWVMDALKKEFEDNWNYFYQGNKHNRAKTKGGVKDWRLAFTTAFVQAVHDRLAEYKNTRKTHDATSTALVVKKNDLVNDYMREQGLKTSYGRASGSKGRSTAAAAAGMTAGSNANIGRGVSGGNRIAIGAS